MRKYKIMRNKTYKIILCVVSIIVFIIASVIFIVNKDNADKYTIDISNYDNVYKLDTFRSEIEKTLNVKFNNLYINNGGEIKVDNRGNIKSLNIDFYYVDNDKMYIVQIEKNDKLYTITKENKKNTNNSFININLEYYLSMIIHWDYSNYQSECNILFNNSLVNDINSNKQMNQYILKNNKIETVDSEIIGTFIQVTFISNDNSYNQLYFKFK